MDELKLIAFDAVDLAVISTNLQDAVLNVGDMAYLAGQNRFAAVLNRFDWTRAAAAVDGHFERRQCALRFEHVRSAQLSGIDLDRKADVLELLAVQFEARGGDDPGGLLTLIFAGKAAVRLDIECIEAELKDLGARWRTNLKPAHPGT